MAKQAQLDWKESIPFILSDGDTIEVNIFALLLSYSRFRIYRVSLSKTQDILFSFLDDAFETLGGVPLEIVTDNMRTVMDEARTERTSGKVNTRFQQFADDYDFDVKPCIAGRPQTKAKVEAPMKLLDEIRAYNGKLDYRGLVELVARINDRANAQVCQGTGRISKDTIYEKHREFFYQAGIPYIGDGNGPRIHDWRHHMAVYSFKQMTDSGLDMYVALPILSAYPWYPLSRGRHFVPASPAACRLHHSDMRWPVLSLNNRKHYFPYSIISIPRMHPPLLKYLTTIFCAKWQNWGSGLSG